MDNSIRTSEGDLGAIVIKEIMDHARSSISRTGRFMLVLSGGSITDELNKDSFLKDPDAQYDKWKIFLADERCVSLDDPDSTWGSMRTKWGQDCALLQQASFPPPFSPKEDGLLSHAAELYSAQLPPLEEPFDLVILGMGPDGHTASLFPPVTLEMTKDTSTVIFIDNSPKPPSNRISLTLQRLCNSNSIIVVAAGASKASVLKDVICHKIEDYPLTFLNSAGNTSYIIDTYAGSLLC